MGEQFEYLKELGAALLSCSKNRLLCDLVILAEGGQEVFAHSVILASVSSKLRVAFEHYGGAKRNSMFRLNLSECSCLIIETVMQFLYTGTLTVQGIFHPDDINKFLVAAQKLGVDAAKLGLGLAVLVSYADPSYFHSIPSFVLTDEDIYLELVDRDAAPATAVANEVIKLTSKVAANNLKLAGNVPDHSYTQFADRLSGAINLTDSELLQNTERKASVDVDLRDASPVAMVSDHHMVVEDPSSLQVIQAFAKPEEECYIENVAVQVLGPELDAINVSSSELKMLSTIFDDEKLLRLKREDEHISGSLVGLESQSCSDTIGEDKLESTTTTDVVSLIPISTAKKSMKFSRPHRGFGRGTKQRVILFCDLCGKTFLRSKEYAEHRRSHTGEKPYMCDLCGKSFGRRRTMIEHRRLHTGERPFLCEVCDKRFATSGELVKHRRFHTGEKPYQCNICGKTFSRCGENADHRRLHAGENICPVCGKEFTRQHNMKEHMNSAHTGLRRYTCSICGKCFAYSSGLRYHRRLHKDERPYACQLCNKSFARGGELNRHERSAHKSQVVEIEVYS